MCVMAFCFCFVGSVTVCAWGYQSLCFIPQTQTLTDHQAKFDVLAIDNGFLL